MKRIINIIKRVLEILFIKETETIQMIIYRKGEPMPYSEDTIENIDYEEI